MSKIYFNPGDVVKVDKLQYVPNMIVINKITLDQELKGILCFWFDNNKVYREQIFSSKDLILISSQYG